MFIRLATGLVVMQGDSCSECRGFKSQHRILDGYFSKNCNVLLVQNIK